MKSSIDGKTIRKTARLSEIEKELKSLNLTIEEATEVEYDRHAWGGWCGKTRDHVQENFVCKKREGKGYDK